MNTILQGTTPKLEIEMPEAIAVDSVLGLELTFKHNDEVKIVDLSGVTVNTQTNTFTYHFTEEETLALDPRQPLFWQLRVKTSAGITGTAKAQISVLDLISEAVMA